MKTILVCDNIESMREFLEACNDDPLFNVAGTFTDAQAALSFAQANRVDFALLGIAPPAVDNLALGKKLRALYPGMVLIFVSASEDYVIESLRAGGDYYVLEPYTLADVKSALERARLLSARLQKPVFIRTFGHFDVFVQGTPVYFSSAKAKELLAVLVDRRGAYVSAGEAISVMWENRPCDRTTRSLYRQAAAKLRQALAACGIEMILQEHKQGRRIRPELFDCDYYMLVDGDKKAQQFFTEEYMSQYSWGELTLGKYADHLPGSYE